MRRQIEEVLISRLKKWRSVALLGARQVGKSYLLSQIIQKQPGAIISFDDPLERQEAARDPVRYLERLYQHGKLLFIDEAARVPEIFSAVKIMVDKYDPKPTGICLANSGNYLLLRRIKESLAGRVCLTPIHPLSWQEFTDSDRVPGLMNLIKGNMPSKITPLSPIEIKRLREERTMWGGFPAPCLNGDYNARIIWIRDYIRTYILPLVVEQFNIRDTISFEQIARLLILSSSQFMNANKISQSVGISQPTVKNYAHYLEAMSVIKHVPIFFRNPTKRLIKHPKIYACDSLLINESLGNNFSIQTALERNELGLIYESFIFNEIQKTLTNHDIFAETFTWRTQDRAEVDIVLSTMNGIIPIETKWSKRLTKKDASGLASFMACYPDVKKGYIVYPGAEIQRITKQIFAIPDWWLLGC